MTVNDIIRELDFCKAIINEMEGYMENNSVIGGAADTMRDAIDIIEKYMDELGRKQIK